MKRLLFLFLVLSSLISFAQPRYFYSRPTPGGPSSYALIQESDLPTITSLPWSSITGTPTTLSGYGITNAWATNSNTTLGGSVSILSGSTGNSITFGTTGGNRFNNFTVNLVGAVSFIGGTGFTSSFLGATSSDFVIGNVGTSPYISTQAANNIQFQAINAGVYRFKANTTQATTIEGEEDADNGSNTGTQVWPSSIAANRTWTWPDKDGTVAMLSDITGFPGPSSGTPGQQLRWDAEGDDLENFTPLVNPCVSADCFALWDGSAFQAGTFTANDFNISSNVISLDYTNGQAASGSTKGFLTAADWTTFNAKQSTGLSWLLASGGTASAANDFISTTTNTITNSTTSLGAYSSPTPGAGGAYFRNTTAAAAGAQQYSPALILEGQGWKTNATAASQSVRFAQYVIPVQGAVNPAGTLFWRTSYNNGSYFSAMNLAVNELNTSATLTVNGPISGGAISGSTGTFSGGVTASTTLSVTQAITTGAFSTGYAAKTALYTLTTTDHTIEVTSGTHTQTLPTAVGATGKIYVITNSGSGTVTVGTTSSQTFVNVSGTPTTLTLNQFQTVMVQSNGVNWLRIATL